MFVIFVQKLITKHWLILRATAAGLLSRTHKQGWKYLVLLCALRTTFASYLVITVSNKFRISFWGVSGFPSTLLAAVSSTVKDQIPLIYNKLDLDWIHHKKEDGKKQTYAETCSYHLHKKTPLVPPSLIKDIPCGTVDSQLPGVPWQ